MWTASTSECEKQIEAAKRVFGNLEERATRINAAERWKSERLTECEARMTAITDIAGAEFGGYSRRNILECRAGILKMWLDEDVPEVIRGEMSIEEWLSEMERRDGGFEVDQDLIMIFRASFMLRSVALELGLRVKLTDVWCEYAKELLAEHGQGSGSGPSAIAPSKGIEVLN